MAPKKFQAVQFVLITDIMSVITFIVSDLIIVTPQHLKLLQRFDVNYCVQWSHSLLTDDGKGRAVPADGGGLRYFYIESTA